MESTKIKLRSDRKGQAAIESAMASGLIFLAITGALLTSFALLKRNFMSHTVYEHMICISQSELRFKCDQILKKNLNLFPFSRVVNQKTRTSSAQISTELIYQVIPGYNYREKQTLSLPLLSERAP